MRWAKIWLVALGRTVVQLSWLWGSILLKRFGYRTEATVLVLSAAAVLAALVARDFLRFRRSYLRQRRRGGP